MGYRPWGRKESDTTEQQLHIDNLSFFISEMSVYILLSVLIGMLIFSIFICKCIL